MLTFSAALFPMWYFLSLYLQLVLHMTPIGAGLAFLPMALTIMVCATRAGRLVGRYGAGPVLGVGLTSMAAGLALFARITVDGGYGQDLLLPGLLASIGVGLAFVPATIAATAGVAPSEAGLASGLLNTSRQMGGALGLALLTSLGTQYTAHLISSDYQPPLVALTNGFRLAFLISAGFAAIGAATAFRFIPRVRPGAPPAPAPAPPAGATVHPLPVAAPPAAPASAPPPAPGAASPPAPHDAAPSPPKYPAPAPPRPAVPARAPAIVHFRLSDERRWPVSGCFTIPVVIEAGERG